MDSLSSDDESLACPAINRTQTKRDTRRKVVFKHKSKRLQQNTCEDETCNDSDSTFIEEQSVSMQNIRKETAKGPTKVFGPEGPNPTNAANIVNATLDNIKEPPIHLTSHQLQSNETSLVHGSSHDDTVVAQKNRGPAEAKQQKKKNDRKTIERKTLFQQKSQEEEMCYNSHATDCESGEEETVHPLLSIDPSTAAGGPAQVLGAGDQSQTEEEPESQSLLQSFPMSTIMHKVDTVSPCVMQGFTPDETEVVQTDRKKKDTSSAGSIQTRRTLFQKKAQDDSNATVSEFYEEENVLNPNETVNSTAGEDSIEDFCAGNPAQPWQTEDEPESQSLLQPLPISSIINKVNGESPGRKTKDRKKKKAGGSAFNDMIQRQEESENLTNVPKMTEEISSLLDETRDTPACPINDELEYNDTAVVQEGRSRPKSKSKKKNKDEYAAQNISPRRTLLQEKAQGKMCDDSNATVCDKQVRTSILNERENILVVAEVLGQSQQEAISFLPNFPTATNYDINNDSLCKKSKELQKKKRKTVEDSATDDLVHIQEEPEVPDLLDVSNMAEETSSLLYKSAAKQKKKKDKSTALNIRVETSVQENEHGNSNPTVFQPSEKGSVSPSNDPGPSATANGQKNKDRKRKRRKSVKENVEEMVQIQDEREDENLADVPNNVEETFSLLNNNKKKKKDKSRAENNETRALIQENVQNDSNATVCEPCEEASVSPPLFTAAEGPAQVFCADSQSQQGHRGGELESHRFLQALPMSTIMHDINDKNQGRRTKDDKKKKKKKTEKGTNDELVQRQEESEDSYPVGIPMLAKERSSLLDEAKYGPVCPSGNELEYIDNSEVQRSSNDNTGVVQEDRSTPKSKPKKRKKEKDGSRRTLLHEKAEGEMCDAINAPVCELNGQEKTSRSHHREDSSFAAELHDQSLQEVREEKSECSSFLPNLHTSIIHDRNKDSLCGKTKDRKKEKWERVETSAKEKKLYIEEEVEGPHMANALNTVEETSSLFDITTNSSVHQARDVRTYTERSVLLASSQDDSEVAQVDKSIQNVRLKKKKKDRSTAPAEWEESENSDAGVRKGVSGHLVFCSDEKDGQKKKKRKRDGDDKQLLSSPSDEPPDDGGFKLKKKKDRKVTRERQESTSTATPLEKEHGSASICDSKGTSDCIYVKKKKEKKLYSAAGAPDRENVLGTNFCPDPGTYGEQYRSCLKKKKIETITCDGVATPEKSEQVMNNQLEIAQGPEDKNVYKSLKKKRKEKLREASSVESMVQCDDEVSSHTKKKRRSSSLLSNFRKRMFRQTKTKCASL